MDAGVKEVKGGFVLPCWSPWHPCMYREVSQPLWGSAGGHSWVLSLSFDHKVTS